MPSIPKYNLEPLNIGSKTIGQRISKLRNDKNLTQLQLAEKIGISRALLSNYELGRNRLFDEMVTRFAIALEVTTDEILGLNEYYANEKKQKYSGKKK